MGDTGFQLWNTSGEQTTQHRGEKKEPRNRTIQIQSTDSCLIKQQRKLNGERILFSTVVLNTGHPYAKIVIDN